MSYYLKSSLAAHVKQNLSIYVFTVILFVMGIIFGAVVVNSLSYDQKDDLFLYLNRFFGHVSSGDMAEASLMFKQSFIHYLKYIGLMWILGVSIIGLPIILILLFLKGIVVGFTVGFLVNQLGLHGFLLSFVSVMPQNIILIPVFLICTAQAIMFSIKMVRQQFIKRVNEPILAHFTNYTLLMVVMIVFISIASVYEAYISPALMKSVVQLFY